MLILTLKYLPALLARLPKQQGIPQWAVQASPHFWTTQGILCNGQAVPERVGCEVNWRGFQVVIPSNWTGDHVRTYSALPEQLLSLGFQLAFIHTGSVGNVYLFVRDPNNVSRKRICEIGHIVTD